MLFSAAVFMGLAAHALDLEFSKKLDLTSAFGFLTTLYNVPCKHYPGGSEIFLILRTMVKTPEYYILTQDPQLPPCIRSFDHG